MASRSEGSTNPADSRPSTGKPPSPVPRASNAKPGNKQNSARKKKSTKATSGQPAEKPDKTSTKATGKPQAPAERRVGKYLLRRKLGAGGMGAVFLAEDTQLGREVALKLLPRDKARNPTLVKRFQAEARSAARLSHDNIVAVYEAGEADGFLYIALEYVEGIDVHELVISRGPLPLKRTITIITQVAEALEHAASRQLVHRDIKPSNLMIRSNGSVKLADLGLARTLSETEEGGITRDGHTVGTVDYMPPEQARDSKLADIRSDIYALGGTWFFMLTGRSPYPDGDLTNKLNAHAHGELPDPREFQPGLSDGVTSILHRMLAKSPEDRYQSPRELIHELQNSVLTQEAFAGTVLAAVEDDDIAINAEDPTRDTVPRAIPARERTENEAGGLQIHFDYGRLLTFLVVVIGLIAGGIWLKNKLSESEVSPPPAESRTPAEPPR